jgi:hypothetical protein
VVLSTFPLVALATYFAIIKFVVAWNLRDPDGSPLHVSGFFSSMSRKQRDDTLHGFGDALARSKWGELIADTNGNHSLKHPDGPHIIVGTIGTMGVGVNLQRAHHVVIMEPQLQNTTAEQAIRQIHRIGQQFETVVEILTSEKVDGERVVQNKHALNALFAKMVEQAKNNINVQADDDEESEEDSSV